VPLGRLIWVSWIIEQRGPWSATKWAMIHSSSFH
jgi:hypothetical protein